jgi:hypothetical protein
MSMRILVLALILAPVLSACTDVGAGASGDTAVRALAAELRKSQEEIRTTQAELKKYLRSVNARMADLQQKTDDVLTALEFLAVDIDAVKRNTWETLHAMQASEGNPEPEMPDDYKGLFEPETVEKVRKLAAEKGIALRESRVDVPAVVIQDRAMLEFFAVAAGGKEHEAVVALLGNVDPEGNTRRAEGLPGMLNACLLALGYQKGTPVKVSRDGKVLPPEGEPIYLYIEWEEDGKTVRARAEDLIYNIQREATMERGKWVYVGSRFERDFGSGEVIYMADVTGDVAATYSWPNTIIDNTTSEGQDDIYYRCFTGRIPKVGTRVTMVFSKKELSAKDFPPIPEGAADENDGGSGK